jgi:phosphatidylglycerol:prolipoprotein diacylglycerol transferase
LLYVPWPSWRDSLREFLVTEWGGRTILGALFGGFVGVELVKRALGVTAATGDPYAVALPLGQGLGRLGCFVGGCCYGAPLFPGSSARHPAQLYEAAFDFAIAGVLFAIRTRPRPAGLLFRWYLLAYAGVRFVVDFFRGDEKQLLGPLSYAQCFCLACGAWLAWDVRRRLCGDGAGNDEGRALPDAPS